MVSLEGAFCRFATFLTIVVVGEFGSPAPERRINMAVVKRKKLYFDVAFGGGTGTLPVAGVSVPATVACLYFPCTQFTASYPGDRFGAVLDALEALTGNAPNGIKAQREVEVWFSMSNLGAGLLTLTNPSATTTEIVAVDLVQPTSFVANHANVTRLRSLNAAGTTLFARAGTSAIYGTLGGLRHFSARVRKTNNAGVALGTSLRGTLYVARQHGIEI
jgi:hypothetical protein